MKFFEDCRPEFYFHGGRLTKDGKSGKRFWKLKLVLTLKAAEVVQCDDVFKNNYVAIETRANCAEEIKIAGLVPDQMLEFYALAEDKGALLRVGPCDLSKLKISREEELTELWVLAEVEYTEALHAFVGEHSFTRLWVEFKPRQLELPGGMTVTLGKREKKERVN